MPSTKKTTPTPMDIGIAEKDRANIVAGLNRLLADTYTLYLKTHNFHWNVTGPMFQTLHLMFMDLYLASPQFTDLATSRGMRCKAQIAPCGRSHTSNLQRSSAPARRWINR